MTDEKRKSINFIAKVLRNSLVLGNVGSEVKEEESGRRIFNSLVNSEKFWKFLSFDFCKRKERILKLYSLFSFEREKEFSLYIFPLSSTVHSLTNKLSPPKKIKLIKSIIVIPQIKWSNDSLMSEENLFFADKKTTNCAFELVGKLGNTLELLSVSFVNETGKKTD